MSLSNDEIARVATLARLALTENETEAFRNNLDGVISLLDNLQSIDTDGVEPMPHPGGSVLRLRADEVSETDQRETLQAAAPETENGYFLVPRVVE